jgi:hypothetical protein
MLLSCALITNLGNDLKRIIFLVLTIILASMIIWIFKQVIHFHSRASISVLSVIIVSINWIHLTIYIYIIKHLQRNLHPLPL